MNTYMKFEREDVKAVKQVKQVRQLEDSVVSNCNFMDIRARINTIRDRALDRMRSKKTEIVI